MRLLRNEWHRLAPERTVAPVGEVITLAEIKSYLRVDHSDEDAVFILLRDAVVQRYDGWAGELRRCLLTQTWKERLRYFPDVRIPLILGPAQSIVSITYFDENEEVQAVPPADYRLQRDMGEAYVELADGASWPSTDARDDAVSIEYACGYGGASADLPSELRLALLMAISREYAIREYADDRVARQIGDAVDRMMGKFRRGPSHL